MDLRPFRLVPLILLAACVGAPLEDGVETAEQPLGPGNDAPIVASKTTRPWAAFVHTVYTNGETNDCSGALIAPNLVLTSPECTVCAASASVYLWGDVNGMGLPSVVHVNAAGGFSTMTGATSSSVTCSDVGTAAKIVERTVAGRSLGLVRLQNSSARPPVKLLTTPPLGFDPLVDVPREGKVVSRGAVSPLDPASTTMREGPRFFDQYANQLPYVCNLSAAPFTLIETDSHAVQAWKGDQGGPWLATLDGTEYLVGVATIDLHTPTQGEKPRAAVTFNLSNAKFIRDAMGSPLNEVDSDGDDVADNRDNCPLDANRDQQDLDVDGVGDVCDNCPPPYYNHSLGYNPGQQNCNAEAEDEAILASMPSLASNGGVRHLTDADYLAGGAYAGNCPGVREAIWTVRRGDQCDSIPCAKASPKYSSAGSAFGQPTPTACGAGGWPGVGTKYTAAMSGWTVDAKSEFLTTPRLGKVGLRWCACDAAHATAAERRLNCSAGPYQCAIDPSRYQLADPKWKRLDLSPAAPNGDTLTSLSFSSGTASVNWNYLADLVALTGTQLPSQPWTVAHDSTISGGPKLRGVLWSRVTEYDGVPIEYSEDDDLYTDLDSSAIANHYREGDHRFITKTSCKRIPRLKPNPKWAYCPMCELELGSDWLEAVNPATPQEQWLAVGLTGSTDVTWAIATGASELLRDGSATLLNAGEEGQLRAFEDGTPRGLIVKNGTLEVTGTLFNKSGKLDGRRIVSAPQTLLAGELGLPIFSAVRQELFALRQRSGQSVTLQKQRLGGAWSPVALRGSRLLKPLAATFAPEEGALYVLDDVGGGFVQLMRVNVDTGDAAVVIPRLLDGAFTSVSLSFGAPGMLLVTGGDARDGRTWAAHLDLTGRTPILLDRTSLPGALMAGSAFETEKGDVAFMVSFADGFEARSLAKSAFKLEKLAITGPVF